MPRRNTSIRGRLTLQNLASPEPENPTPSALAEALVDRGLRGVWILTYAEIAERNARLNRPTRRYGRRTA